VASKADFSEAMTLTLGHEGGWYDGSDPRDPNPTMWGIIQKTYDAFRTSLGLPTQTVRNITLDERDTIYRRYWTGVCEPLPRLLALLMFDMSINAGPQTARIIVQRALDLDDDGHLNSTIDDDGNFGPKTLAALRAHGADARDTLVLYALLERLRYYNEVAENPRLRPNLKSWVGRTFAFYDKYVRP
jgi:Putative secretion activating protein